MFWDLNLGKGIDDAKACLVRDGIDVTAWILETIELSKSREIYHYISRGYRLDPHRPIERETEGDYLPGGIAISPGKITAIIADTGSGKTFQIAEIIRSCRAQGLMVIVFAPTNKIGEQLAVIFGIPHRNAVELREDGAPMEQADILSQARELGGLIICPDSIDWARLLVKNFNRYAIVCDEAAKVAEHLAVGATIKDRYAAVNQSFADLVAGAQSLILAEAKISERDLIFYERLSGKTSLVYRHRRHTAKRDINMYVGASGAIRCTLLAEIVQRLERGERVLIPTDSQRMGESIERYLQMRLPDLQGMRLDAHTSYLPDVRTLTRMPNQYLAATRLDYLIFSPSCKAGWDLKGWAENGTYGFDAVCAMFVMLPTSDHIQMIARYRPCVPVSIACPERIQQSNDEVYQSSKALQAVRTEELQFNYHFVD
ncbi:MAG: AAA family ATPase [Chamaesiphon sp. CSU_1_12]|nr:AAA family ATPase [Chamaesiphon sp. CSU_1_12]